MSDLYFKRNRNRNRKFPPPPPRKFGPLENIVYFIAISSEIVKTKNMNVNTNTLQTSFGCALGFGTKSVTKRVRYHLALYSTCRLAKPVAYRSATVSGQMMRNCCCSKGSRPPASPTSLPAAIDSPFLLGYGPLTFASIGLPQGRSFQLCKAGASVPEVVHTRIPFGTKYMLTN